MTTAALAISFLYLNEPCAVKGKGASTMSYASVASIAIFAVTLFLMIKRPKGMNLGLAAGIGAIASLLLGTVTLTDAVQSFGDIWDAALAFIGIVALSVTLDAMGFFKWAALRVVKLARGSGVKLYFYVSLLTAAVSILFANDSAVLILTPIVLEIVSQLKIDAGGRRAYLFAAGLIADTAAMPLITSNPVNILSADFFKYSFIDHLVFMAPVAVATIISSLLLVYVFFRKSVPKAYSVELVDTLIGSTQPITPLLLKVSVATLVAIDIGYVVASLNRLPVSFVICAGALFLLAVYRLTLNRASCFSEERKGLKSLAREINWDIVVFMISIFLVVQGLTAHGLNRFLGRCFCENSCAALSFLGACSKLNRDGWRQLHEQLANDHTRPIFNQASGYNGWHRWASVDKLDFLEHYRKQPWTTLLPSGLIGDTYVAGDNAQKRR